jgi:hypothetical protein
MFFGYSNKEIISITLLSILVAATAYCIYADSYLSTFFSVNFFELGLILFIFFVVILITSLFYQKTLINYDESTISTSYASFANILIWSAYWVWWGIAHSSMLLKYPIKSEKIEIFSFLLSLGIPLCVFAYTLITNLQQIKDDQASASTPKDWFLKKWYSFSGYYSLVGCIVYLFRTLCYS